MKICFCVELPNWESWDDGLRGAMRIIEMNNSVHYHLDGKISDHCKPDVVLVWGGTLSQPYLRGKMLTYPKILLFAGGPREPEYFTSYNLTCFENDVHTIEGQARGIQCMTAFGTNTKVFKPIVQPKVFDAVYPAAFGLWKRKDLFAASVKGLKALTFGNIQYQEMQCWNVCQENGVAVSPPLPQATVPYFMAMGKSIVVLPVPEIGCQRTVLEAMAMKLPVIVPSDAPLVTEFARHGGIIVEPKAESINYAIRHAAKMADVEAAYKYVTTEKSEVTYANRLKVALKRVTI